MKKMVFLGVFALLAMPQSTQAAVVLAVDNFRNLNPGDPPAYIVQDSIDLIISRTNIGLNSIGSTDGTFGSLASPAASTGTANSSESFRWVNGIATATLDFAFTDTSGADRSLTTFHFDSGATRPNAARNFELFLVDGMTETSLASDVIPSAGAATPTYADFDLGLGGLTLAANSTVNLSLRFTGGDGSGGHHGHFDNLALSAVAIAVPEPSSAAIIGLIGIYGLVRRRRTAA
ncbi:hypothetical protein CA13_07270 [Planctomycetes bacterium CA13]|uniref:PEP-CTERM protein-sorting domain-containing protein n=1 Tax=Novipirellula herctigrandis TaxID=2527986 RepID=A0A5C5YWD2_9BACT|nr:hypothetical protein CA13_07270 [Planctomycetes bacterium CA13]